MGNAVMDAPVGAAASTERLVIDFLYLDLETCTRCRGTDANLEAALAEVRRVLDAAGVEVAVRKTLVGSAEQARALGFVSSPTIRVNGRDIALDLRESHCESCAEACACGGTIDCRVWVWRGEEYTEAPTAMIVDAVLGEVYAGATRPAAAAAPMERVPDNLARFFDAKARVPVAADAGCCGPAEHASCCEPSAKASCCGAASAEGCGCK